MASATGNSGGSLQQTVVAAGLEGSGFGSSIRPSADCIACPGDASRFFAVNSGAGSRTQTGLHRVEKWRKTVAKHQRADAETERH